MMVVGLAGLASQAAMLTPCLAWDYLPAGVLEESDFIDDSNSQAEGPPMAQLAGASADEHVSAQAIPATGNFAEMSGGRITDKSVEQAGYYNSRPRPTSRGAGIQQPNSNRSGAMFRGQKVRMPSGLFGRQQPNANKPTTQTPQANAEALRANAARQQSRMGATAAAASRPMPAAASVASRPMPQRVPNASPQQARNAIPQRGSSALPAATGASGQAARMASERPPQPIRTDYAPRQMAPQQPVTQLPPAQMPQLRPANSPAAAPAAPVAANPNSIPNSTSVSPWKKPLPQAPSMRPAATALPPAAIQSAAPVSEADRAIAEAHELSTRAETEEDYTHIIETCRRALASQPSEATSKYSKNLLGWSLNRRGQIRAEGCREKEAILDFDDAIRTDATCWRALHNRGVLLAQDSQFEKAFDDFSKTIQLNPNFAKAYSNRAALFMVANNLEAALADYNRAIAIDAKLAVAHRGCGRVCQLLGQTDDAVAHYDAAVQLAPTDAYAAACRADMLTDIGRYAEAIGEYERAIEIDPSSNQAQGGSAWLLATCPDSKIRNPELAIERAYTVIEQGGEKDAVNYDTLAAALASAGDFKGAMASVRKAMDLAPQDERDAYKDRFVMYQQAKPYRISPIERETQQVSYETAAGEGPSLR
jgi:tetratricopeptide (TPR) repeat protein